MGGQEVDMENRDINALNSHINVSFEEVFGEPEAVHSIDCAWRTSYKCYNCTLSCCYKVLTVLCAVPLAFCWACEFACTACYHVWVVTPTIKICAIDMMAFQKLFTLCLNAFVGPCCETMGMCFSKIGVTNK